MLSSQPGSSWKVYPKTFLTCDSIQNDLILHCQLKCFHHNNFIIIIKIPIFLEFKFEVVPLIPFFPVTPDAP